MATCPLTTKENGQMTKIETSFVIQKKWLFLTSKSSDFFVIKKQDDFLISLYLAPARLFRFASHSMKPRGTTKGSYESSL